jgi:hypothetical protein
MLRRDQLNKLEPTEQAGRLRSDWVAAIKVGRVDAETSAA